MQRPEAIRALGHRGGDVAGILHVSLGEIRPLPQLAGQGRAPLHVEIEQHHIASPSMNPAGGGLPQARCAPADESRLS